MTEPSPADEHQHKGRRYAGGEEQLKPREPGIVLRLWRRIPGIDVPMETATMLVMTAFFLFYGLVPIFGGDSLGLVGADEPRYAQIAREMLQRHDYITPVLWGHPWLEKPALYYWRAMFAFKDFGIHDWSARLPSASFAFMLVFLIWLHMRRFRNGGQLDAALLTASCAGILSFARGASTDMQLAAPFCIGMLGWYAWYETNSKFWLFDLYFFIGAATLAKGPVAPLLALVIIGVFAGLRREWSLFRRSLWPAGFVLYFAMVLPWYIEVQRRNPTFLKVFFLQQNLERLATNRFEHYHPFWYFIPVVLLGLTPWAVIAVTAFADAVGGAIKEWKARGAKARYIGHERAGDAFPEFLVLWAVVVIVFFSFSESKLPGYILPAVPPLTILAGDYLNRIRRRGLKTWLLVLHAVLTGLLTMFVLLMPLHLNKPEAIPKGVALVAAGLVGGAATVFILIMVARFGLKRLRVATLTPVVMLMLYLLGVGPVFGIGPVPNTKRNIELMNMTFSARPMAKILDAVSPPPSPLAVFRVRRELQYGLGFYRDQRIVNYDVGIVVGDLPASAGPGPHGVVIKDVKEGSSADEFGMVQKIGDDIVAVNGQPVLNAADFDQMEAQWHPGVNVEFEIIDPRTPDQPPQFLGGTMDDGIPLGQHLLVAPESAADALRAKLAGREYEPLFSYPWQDLEVYRVMAEGQRQSGAGSR